MVRVAPAGSTLLLHRRCRQLPVVTVAQKEKLVRVAQNPRVGNDYWDKEASAGSKGDA